MQEAVFHITGRIGSIEIKDKVAYMDVAAYYGRKVGDTWEDDTHWNRVTLFGKHIERAARMAVGDLVNVRGTVRQTRYERNGSTVYGVDLRAVRFGVLASNGRPSNEPVDDAEE